MEFSRSSGPTAVQPGEATLLTFFRLLFQSNLLLLVLETNCYAAFRNAVDWGDVDLDKMERFIGIMIMMGITRLPQFDMYWSRHNFLRNPVISNCMTAKGFKAILRYLHLADPVNPPVNDRLYKVRTFVDNLNEAASENFNLDKNISVDKILIPSKGRTFLKQHIQNKPHKWGIKLWALADSVTSYLWKFKVYAGREGNVRERGQAYNVVTRLCQPLYNRHHSLFVENFYSRGGEAVSRFTRQWHVRHRYSAEKSEATAPGGH